MVYFNHNEFDRSLRLLCRWDVVNMWSAGSQSFGFGFSRRLPLRCGTLDFWIGVYKLDDNMKIFVVLGAKYLDFVSSCSLKTRELSFAQFVYLLREVCLFFNFWMIKFTIMSKKQIILFSILPKNKGKTSILYSILFAFVVNWPLIPYFVIHKLWNRACLDFF